MADTIKLPAPKLKGSVSLEEAIEKRRTIRVFGAAPLTLEEVSQLLWSAQGITSPTGLRAAPSPIALFLVNTYFLAGNVAGLQPGFYHYTPAGHSLELIKKGDLRREFAKLGQAIYNESAATLVFASLDERAKKAAGDNAQKIALLEMAHIAENVLLQATALDLASVPSSGFDNDKAREILGVPADETPLYFVPVGKKG
jgi:SagB-type dehydrogenase family enzyme